MHSDEISFDDGPAVSVGSGVRAVMVGTIITLIMAALILRVAHIQFSDPVQYTRLAASGRRSVPSPAKRGNIYDCKDRLLATSVPMWSVFADPSEVQSPLDTARILSHLLDVDVRQVYSRLLQSDRRFVWIKRQVSHSRAEWVRAVRLNGVHLRREHSRFYPFGELCAHVVGFTDIDGRGLEGAEARFDDMLSGAYYTAHSDGRKPEKGYDIRLTLDAYIQAVTRQALMQQVERHEPEAAWALVLDVRNGGVLAMVNWPSFDPGAPAANPPSHRRNRIIADTYEYGSVMKPITAAIALEKGIVEPDTEFECHYGAWRFGRRTIHDVREHGLLSVSDILTYSSNIGMAQIGLELGREPFWEGLRRFGFGQLTGIELPGESIGIMRSPARWSDHSLISVAFGQEISVNGLALAGAYMALANDGVVLRPGIVDRITDPVSKKVIYERDEPEELGSAVSAATAGQVVQMMSRVVQEGTGRQAAVEYYRTAGKTGTGTLMCEEGLGYSRGRYISTFVGLAPVENPRIVVLVSLKVPRKGGYYGGTVAGPAFREITRETLGYLDILPEIPTDYLARANTSVCCENIYRQQ